MEIEPSDLKKLLFPDTTCDLDAANKIRTRLIMDWIECRAIPAWLALAIKEDPAASNIMYVQVIEEHYFLWPAEVWRTSNDRKMHNVASKRQAIAADIAAQRAQSAVTVYQRQAYQFVTDLAARLCDNYFPYMKKGYLKSTFQGIIARTNYDLARFKAILIESFDEDILNACWVNEPEKPKDTHDNNDRQVNASEAQQIPAPEEEVTSADGDALQGGPGAGCTEAETLREDPEDGSEVCDLSTNSQRPGEADDDDARELLEDADTESDHAD